MEGKSAQEAVRDRLGITLSERQSRELYIQLSQFLVAKDELAYIALLKTKYVLLQEGASIPDCDFLVMEILLEELERGHPLPLAAMVYLVRHSS